MRPVTLRLDGFRSYASEIEIDWSDRNLVGVVGPIGSGKSTILDAICFALYGKTPTEKSNQRSLIHQRADVGKVELVFDVDGVRWKAVRAMRRKGQSAHALYRIDPDDPDGDPLETVLGSGDVDAQIKEVLGVDFDGFNRSVMLAQGRFSDFLNATNTERDKVLKGVFGLDKVDEMESIAKRIRDGAKRDLEEFGRRQADLANVKALAERAGEVLATSTERHAALLERQPVIRAAEAARLAAQVEIDRTTAQTASLKELADRMPDGTRSRQILKEHATRSTELATANESAKEIDGAADAASQERRDLLEATGGEAKLTAARQQAARHADAQAGLERERQRQTDARSKAEAAEALVKKAGAEAETAVSKAEAMAAEASEAAEAVNAAEDALHEGRHADMAATLRSGLVADAECPVCAQEVHNIPAAGKSGTALVKLERAREETQAVLSAAVVTEKTALAQAAQATEAATSAEKALLETETMAVSATASYEAALAAFGDIEQSLAAALGDRPIERLAELDASLRAFDVRLQELEAKRKLAHTEVERGQAGVVQAEKDLRTLSSTVSRLATQLGVEQADLLEAAETDELLTTVRQVWIEQQNEALEVGQAAVASLAAATSERAKTMEAVGLSPEDDFGKALSDSVAAVAGAQREVDVRKERLLQSTDLDERIAVGEAVVTLYDDLAKDLRPAAFLGYLLEEERAELGRVSSEQFEQLSGGRYRFSDDGEFNILDLNAAEQVRKASTLSGGETFLASLALALALAEMVSRGSGRLDSFFLDEGFGSLDAEHLDLAMAGVESLVAGHDERLVVIVSHVPDMKDRIEDLIVLDKDAATGATVVLRS